ncbi:MAG: MlaD family protein [Bacteroidota bacterium]
MKLSKEAKIGLIITAGIALLFWGLNFLKGRDFFSSQNKVFAVYDHIDGLAPSNLVQVNGMKVGSVRRVDLLPDFSGRILVTMNIKSNVRIPRNSTAQIFSTDLLGTKGIRFVFGDSKDLLQEGDTLVSEIQPSLTQEVNQQVAPIRAKAENILASMDSVLVIVRTVFNETTRQNLRRSFESISKSLSSIESVTNSLDREMSREGRLRSMFENLSSITENLKNNNEKITDLIENFSAISDTVAKSNLSETLEHTRRTLEGTSVLFDRINKGEGTLGQLATNDSLYDNLNSSARKLNELMTDLKDHPKRYVHFSVFGKKDK